MENKYELIMNLNNEMKDIYERYFKTEGYEILVNNKDLIFAKKNNNCNEDIDIEKKLTRLIISIVRKYKHVGVLYVDFSNVVNLTISKTKNMPNDKVIDNKFTWYVRQSITRAIVERNKV